VIPANNMSILRPGALSKWAEGKIEKQVQFSGSVFIFVLTKIGRLCCQASQAVGSDSRIFMSSFLKQSGIGAGRGL
jgi:hypothetical protein